jgi:hypothetical protein
MTLTRRDVVILRVFALWTMWVWATRIWNIVGDEARSNGFKAIHVALAVVSIAFAVWTLARTLTRRA